ncbi:MAG: glycosyltransferase family 4 protein [Anaerolineae bacterium]|nr:glycosyltransferase family 4 protein [Anaerolineae bacterium]
MLIGIDASRAVVAQRTGTEAYALHLSRALLEQGTAHRFRLYFNAAPPPGLFAGSQSELRSMPFPRLWTHVRLSLEMLLRAPDVLFVPSHVLPLIHPRCSVVTVHDLGHRYYPEAHTPGQRRYLEWSTRYHVRTAAHLLADSEATRDDLVRLYGAASERITVAHLGVDPALRPVHDVQARARVCRRYGIEGDYLLYVGTLQPRKNLVRLIEAFGALAEAGAGGPRLSLVLAGKRGWLYDAILDKAQERGLAGRVLLPGYVDDADLGALYSGATLFVMPSLYEGFCMPVLEAMACGAPVVCSNASSLPEVVGDAALTFDPLDVRGMARALERLLIDEHLRAECVSRGRARAAQFTWQACAQTAIHVLERVVRERGGMSAHTGTR